jgi:hypothetical protein
MSDFAKIALGAIASLVVGIMSGVVGYHMRDSFDAPKLKIEKSRYRITRKKCALSAEQFYRFKTTRTLLDALEESVPWSVNSDVEQGEFEYDHVEDVIRQLPPRREQLQREAPYTASLQSGVQQFLAQDTPENREHVRRAIAFLAGLQPMTAMDRALAKGEDRLASMYADFEAQPQAYATGVLRSITAHLNRLNSEISVIDGVSPELKTYYDQGRPAAMPMVGDDLTKLPNVEFIMTLSNTGRTDGQVSYRAVYRSDGDKPYEINLVGQNPQIHRPLSPHYYAVLEHNKIGELVYGVDRISNQPGLVRTFYDQLKSDHGLTGTFVMTALDGSELRYPVRDLLPYN